MGHIPINENKDTTAPPPPPAAPPPDPNQPNKDATAQAQSDEAKQMNTSLDAVTSGAGPSKGFASTILTSGAGLLNDSGGSTSTKKNRLLGF